MKLTLKIWRQDNAKTKGKMVDYPIDGIEGDMSFLEMLDVLNEELVAKGEEPVEFVTIVVKEFVVLVLYKLTGSLTGQTV